MASIFRETKKIKFKVIVVDNGSKDGSPELVRKKFPQVKLIKLDKNIGFGKANNLGTKEARGDWLLFLNSDTVIKNGAIEKIFAWLQGREVDVVGCKLQNKDGSLQQSVGFFPTLSRVFSMMFFIDDLPFFKGLPYQQKNKKFYKKDQEIDWATGAFLLVKKDLFEKVGGFDEHFFMYAEEVDLCHRLKGKGARIWYTPRGEIIHLKGESSKDGFEAAVLGEFRGLISFFKKYRPFWQMPLLKFTLFSGALLRVLLFGIINREKAKTYAKTTKEIL